VWSHPHLANGTEYDGAKGRLNAAEREETRDDNRLIKAVSMQKQFSFLHAKSTSIRKRISAGLQLVDLASASHAHASQMLDNAFDFIHRLPSAVEAMKHLAIVEADEKGLQRLQNGQPNEQAQFMQVSSQIDSVKHKLTLFAKSARSMHVTRELMPWLSKICQSDLSLLKSEPLPHFEIKTGLAHTNDAQLMATFDTTATVVCLATEAANNNGSGEPWAKLEICGEVGEPTEALGRILHGRWH